MMAARDAIRRGLRWLGTFLMLPAVAASTRPIP
jgi:hypothetical protein